MMTNFTRPMKACALMAPDEEHTDEAILQAIKGLYKMISGPRLVSIKKDGIRGFRANKSILSNTLKHIPNKSVCDRAQKLMPGIDIELCNDALPYDQVESIVMSQEHPNSDMIKYYIIDWFQWWNEHRVDNYEIRYYDAWAVLSDYKHPDVVCNLPFWAYTPKQLFEYFLKIEEQDGEGICFRLATSPYLQKDTLDNRGSLTDQSLIKLCRYVRQEVTIVSAYEQMENCNPTNRNAVGSMDRSSNQENKIGKNTLGGFTVRDKNGQTFDVGTGVGLTDVRRKELWSRVDDLIGKTITIKHKPYGQKIKPRSPVMVGFRDVGY